MDGSISINVQDFYVQTALQEKLARLLDDDETRLGINEILLEQINKYVPEGETGDLRFTSYATPENLVWPVEYAHYQFTGKVYGPNFLIKNKDGDIVGWRSKSDRPKRPTGRPLGWYYGYTTPGTGPNWANKMWQNERRITNIRITNYMKRRIKELGL